MICVHVPLAPSVKWETEAERQREQREATPMEEAVDGGRGRGKRREDRERGRERVAGKEGERKAADAAKSVRFSLGEEQPKEEGGKERGAREDGAADVAHGGLQQVETVQEDGSKVVVCANGTRKVISANGQSITLHFFNGDIKHIKPDHSVVRSVRPCGMTPAVL